MRPDHVPTMAGEDNSNPGYHTKGRLWAIGYMRGPPTRWSNRLGSGIIDDVPNVVEPAG